MITIIQSDPQVPAGVFAEHLAAQQIPFRTVRLDQGEALPAAIDAGVIIVLGGNMGVDDEDRYPFLLALKQFMHEALDAEVPLLGICLGGQLLAAVGGGRFTSNAHGEKGLCSVALTPDAAADPLMAGLPPNFLAFQWHNDSFDPPLDATHLATSTVCPGQAFRLGSAWGVQFHPEVNRTIVAGWCGRASSAQPLADAFVQGEAAHRALALRLLENFLAVACVPVK